MMPLFALALAETEELAPLLMPPIAFAGIAVALFLSLAFVVWSFRDVANRHTKSGSGHDSHGAGH
jgi:hypothetical protein